MFIKFKIQVIHENTCVKLSFKIVGNSRYPGKSSNEPSLSKIIMSTVMGYVVIARI